MKKILLSVLTLTTLGASAQIVNIPDANFKAYLVGNTAINTGGDPNEIEVSEATAFTGYLNCQNSAINNLTGIEAFTNVTYLRCDDNNLGAVDLSSNIALISFECNFGQITSLILPNTTTLTEIILEDNQIGTLDVSGNTNLDILECYGNSIASLDLSLNTALTYLDCSDNLLTSLNLSQNTALTSISLEYNQLTSLDVSVNTALTALYCNNNSLTSLNLANGNNPALVYFYAVNNPNLTCIQVDDASYSSANINWYEDVTASYSTNCSACTVNIPDANFKAYLVGNTAINTGGDPNEIECSEAAAFTGQINCSNLSIADLTGVEAFTALTSLWCYANSLTVLDVSNNTALTELRCRYNSLIALDVSNNIVLTSLWCHFNSLTSLNVSTNTALELLECHDNSLTTLDVTNNTALTVFKCYNNSLTTLNVTNNTALTYLSCNHNSLTSLNVANGNNTNLTSFRAAGNPNLTCIQVDDVAYSTTNWTVASLDIDAIASFSTNCGTVGVNEITQNLELTTYPNPTTGKVIFSTTEQISSIEIYNLTGQKVTTFNNTNTIDISNLSNGVYFAKIITGTSKLVMQKIIKE